MILSRAKNSVQQGAQAAFTLVEVVVAVGILGISFVSLYAGMSAGFALTQVSRENLRATQIMVEKMEGIRLFNWNQVTASNMIPATFTTKYYPKVGEGKSAGVTYSGTITVTNLSGIHLDPLPSNYSGNMRAVTVQVQWMSGSVLRSRSMTTLISKDGLQNYVFDN